MFCSLLTVLQWRRWRGRGGERGREEEGGVREEEGGEDGREKMLLYIVCIRFVAALVSFPCTFGNETGSLGTGILALPWY